MVEDRFDDALSDTALDRTLSAMLAVAPSPEFLARVRMRVAEAPIGGRMWGRALAVPVVAAALLVAAWSVGGGFSQPDALPTVMAGGDIALAVETRVVSAEAEPAPAGEGAARVVGSRPAIVVSPAEAEGIRALLRASAEGYITADASPSEPAPELMALEAIAIEPLLPLSVLE